MMASSQYFVPFRPTMGLLTTVAELPHSFKMRYIRAESPLDLSVKTNLAPMTPPSTPSPKLLLLPRKKRKLNDDEHAAADQPIKPVDVPILADLKAITIAPAAVSTALPLATVTQSVGAAAKTQPAATGPPAAKKRATTASTTTAIDTTTTTTTSTTTTIQPTKAKATVLASAPLTNAKPSTGDALLDADFENVPPKEKTPRRPIKVSTAPPKSVKAEAPARERKQKAVRKLKFDEYKSSPVSGTIIRLLDDITAADDDDVVMESGDIDPEYNIVEVTDEVKAEIATIPNVIGGYACKLCRIEFDDVFGLARHRCSCIVLLEYRCPECGKRFNCPANLASHRRWHKPKDEAAKQKKESAADEPQFPCAECGKSFKRQAYLRKHLLTHRTKKSATTGAAGVEAKKANGGAALRSSSAMSTDDGSKVPDDDGSEASYRSDCNSNSAHSMMHGRSVAEPRSDDESRTSDGSAAPRTHFRMFEGAFTEEENLAAAALAHLRNGPSVIRHTTAMTA